METTLIIPGHGGSGPDHWQTWFEARLGKTVRVQQGDWTSLDLPAWAAAVRWEIDRQSGPLTIVGHGFGCLAAVQAASDYSDRISGAMLVAPFDPHNLRLAPLLPEVPLEFPSLIVASRNDPYMRLDRAAFWAGFWSSDFLAIGAAGGINSESGFGPWPQGLELLERFKQSSATHTYRSAATPVSRSALAV